MKKIMIKNVTVYDGLGNRYENSAVLFDSEIIAVDRDALAAESGADDIVDGGGRTVMPGLVECHCHLTVDAARDFGAQNENDTPARAAVNGVRNCRRFLENGVTSVRTLGSRYDVDIEIRDMIEEGLVQGPNLVASGMPLTMTGGHGYSFSHEVDGVDEVMKFARLQIKKGADVIKVFASGGGMTKGVKPGAAQMSREEMRAVCIEAVKTGKTTAAHSQSVEGNKNAIRAGITSIEHGIGLDEEAVALMKERGTFLVATLSAPYNTVKNGVAGGIPDWAVKKNQEAQIPLKEAFQLALRSGVRIAAGTDAGTPFNFHGDFATELELMYEYGMGMEELIVAATHSGAELLGIDGQTGSLERGKLADLIVLEEDPMKGAAAFRRINRVYKGGERVR